MKTTHVALKECSLRLFLKFKLGNKAKELLMLNNVGSSGRGFPEISCVHEFTSMLLCIITPLVHCNSFVFRVGTSFF